MPIFDVQAPNGKIYSVEAPEGTAEDQIFAFVNQQMGAEPKPKEGVGAAFMGGVKRYGSDLETALESIINPKLAAERGVERTQKIGEQYAPGASLDKVIQAYKERGIFPAAGEAISQIPSALAEQFPNTAAALGGARLGAMAGSAIAPGVGTVIGGVAGAGLASLPQLYAQNIQRQAEEKAPEISRAGALGAAVPGAALEVASQFIPLGRGLLGKILGPQAEEFLKRGASEAVEKAAKESILGSVTRGGITGLATEIPTEVAQQMLERLQAGLSLTTDDALKEYGEAAYGAGLVGGPFGAGARTLGRSGAQAEYRQQVEREQQEELAAEQQLQAEQEAQKALEPETYEFPGGYTATAEEVGRSEVPEGYQIYAEGSETPLTQVEKEEDVQPKLERLNNIRKAEAEKALEQIDKISEDINKARTTVETLEATGQTQTEQYMQAQETLRVKEEQGTTQTQELMDKVQTLSAPLTSVAMPLKTKIQNEYVLTKGDEVIGRFPTPGQAEAMVAEQVGPEEYQKQYAAQQGRETLKAQLAPMLKKFNLQDVGLDIVDQLEKGAGGKYVNKLISVAMDEPDPVRVMKHESIHALKDLGFFTPQQIKVLNDRASKEWVNKYLGSQQTEIDGKRMSRLEGYRQMGLSEDEIIEEAIADAFGDFDAGAKPPPGMIASLFKRIKAFFEALRNSFRGAGFQTADDIFKQIESGKLKPTKEATGEVKFSQAPAGVPQNIWDLHEKSAAADKAALTWNVGQTKANATKAVRNLLRAVEQHIPNDEQAQLDFMVKMNEESGRRERAAEDEKLSLPQPEARAKKETAKAEKPITQAKVGPQAPQERNAWKATPTEEEQAIAYEEANGILPYVSEGPVKVSTEKYSIQRFNPEKHLEFNPALGVPINKDGTVTLYYHTTKEKAVKIGNQKVVPSEGRNRVYLTNESVGADILRNRGNFEQDLDGSTVLIYANPELLQLDKEYDNGRRDFFIPITQGDYFNKKMKLQSIQKGRGEAIVEEFSYGDHEGRITSAVTAYQQATPAERKKMVAAARKFLKKEHNVSSLLSENGKLEKTRVGDYNLTYDGNSVASLGLGLASAQQISEKVSTCPRSAICEGLCLGETSGGNFMFGGAAQEDVGDIKKSSFRAAARMMQYLKTEALIVHPEEFTTLLQGEIDSFSKWANSPTERKRDPVTKAFLNIEKEIYAPAIRLNVTSDFKPDMFKGLMAANPDVTFYDYTKLGSDPIAPNHHLTFSSTGFGQIIKGEKVFFKDKAGRYDHNWATMRDRRLNKGQNVAMAFSSKSALPKFLQDEETGTTYRVLDGDDYDARFLDESSQTKQESNGLGVIVGLRNKAGNLSEKNAVEKTGGFFVQYDPKTDGDTIVVPNQAEFKQKVIPIAKGKLSLRAAPNTPEFKRWFGNSKVVDKNGDPLVVYHGTYKDISEFKLGEKANRTGNPDGFYFTPDAQEASGYADRGDGADDGNVMPVYLKIENPFLRGSNVDNRMLGQFEKELRAENPNLNEDWISEKMEIFKDKASRNNFPGIFPNIAFTPAAMTRVLQAGGYDGFKDGSHWIAIKPEQIKSATGNVGTYDIKNPDIRYSLRAAPNTPEFKRFFGNSVVVDNDGKPKPLFHSTYSDFDTPRVNYGKDEYRRWGFHVGPLEAAESRIDVKGAEDEANRERSGNASPNVMPFWVRAEKPLRLEETRSGRWGVDDIMQSVMDKADKGEIKGISDEAINDYFNDRFDIEAEVGMDEFDAEPRVWQDHQDWKDGERSDLLNVFLQQLGYDSIVYDNKFEGGGDSYIVFKPNQVKSVLGNTGAYGKTGDVRYSLRQVKEIFDRAEKISEPPGVESIREQWIGGVSGIGDRNAMYDLYRVDGSKKYIQDVQDFIRKELGDAFKGYRLMSNEELEEIQTGSMGSQFASFTLNPDVARAFKNIPANAKKTGMSVVEMDLTPEHVAMIGHPGELELVVDYGQGYNPDEVKVVEKYSQQTGDVRYSLKTSFPTAAAAVEATKDITAPDTREFKLFQGASTLKEDGKPKLMFHGSKNIFFTFRDNDPIFVAEDADSAEYFARDKGMRTKASAVPNQIYPLWVRAETPFDFENPVHVDSVVQLVGDDKILEKMREGDWRTIEGAPVQKALKQLGFDSFYVNELRDDTGQVKKNLAVFKANQVKSATGNFGDFSEKRDIRYSLPNISASANAAVGRVTTTRETKGWAERLVGALGQENYSSYRQQALNRYNRLGEADKLRAEKMGGAALLASNSAESAALMSDLHSGVVASVMGVGDRRGGIPILRNGITTVDHSQKGVTAIFAPLAQYQDPKVYQYFQFYSAVKRGARLLQEGRERVITPQDVKHAQELGQKFPEFEGIRKEWVSFNNALVKYQVDTGVLSKKDADVYTMYSDYIPFYRQMDGERTLGPNIFQSISGVKKPKALKGGEAPLADFLETVVRNTHAAIGAGMKNVAAQRAVSVGKDVGIVQDIQPGHAVSALEQIVVLENGVKTAYQANDQLFVDAVKSLNMPELPFMSILSAPANLLRNLVTKDPGFIMTNLLRDSLSAYVTSGTNATPIAGTVINFAKAMKGNSPSFEALMDAGIIGGYEFSANVEQSGATLAKDLARKSGKGGGILTPFTSLWEGLEKASTASDAATRMAVYDRVLQETGNEAEALYRALEVMNFNRKGSSAVVRILTAAVPFLNARMQGLDIFYRASFGRMNTADAKEIQRKFFVRGMTMMGLSALYYFAVAGSPDYEKQEQETKDNNWLIPGVGIKIPIPFEVGTLFKTVPERILAYYFGTDTGEDFKKAMWRAANGFIPMSPAAYIPQTLKPLLEVMTNYSFFTQREIVNSGLKDVDPEFQVGPGTSAMSQFVGKTLGLSPMKVDHMLKGYTGTMGMYAIDMMDSVMDQFGDSPKPSKRFEQMPVIKRFALDPEARGSVTNYYELKDSVDTAVRTMNLLERSAKPQEFAEYLQKNVGVLAVKDYVSDLEKSMKDLRDMKRTIQGSPMKSDEKRDAITAIGQAESNLTQNIQTVKRAISELK